MNTTPIEKEIINFVRRASLEDNSLWQGRNLDLAHNFFKFLGFYRFSHCSSRPDSDPKWTPVMWCAEERGYVSNVRVITLNSFYAKCAIEIAKERNSTLPNGWPLSEVISALLTSRKFFKRLQCSTKYEGSERHESWSTMASISKYLLNSLFPMIGFYGGAYAMNIHCHDIVAAGREKVAGMLKRINKTGVVLCVNTDEIAYSGEQVDFSDMDVHHEKFNTLVFTGNESICYGNGIMRTGRLPRVRLTMEEELYFAPHDDAADKCRRVAYIQKSLNTRLSSYKASLAQYLNLTKEDIDRKYSIDSECDSL